MKKRVRFGIRVKLPFGLFPNVAIFVLYVTAPQFASLQEKVAAIQAILYAANQSALAERLFVEEA